ncbi:hypothetical protein BDQ12DRAFT_151185 [Crucibulum laeve]|uniref:VHS domain-containing protein n=1 Tax=Crucibulum laeve TaxID=68775 RepID=A0A5C3M0I0_9AGAR|nr:hypothetical protein BDQ12DRAFT_151185 [Crucibulum laeve]
MSNGSNQSLRASHLGKDRDRDNSRKRPPNAPVALNILRSLDPPRADLPIGHTRSYSEERYNRSESGHGYREREKEQLEKEKKEKKGFWSRDKDKDKDRDRERLTEREKERGREKDRRDEEGQAELTRMIGYLTATASEDWALVLEVCDRASANENNAKEAVRALRREFKYGEPPAQLSAARLWAIMLRNSSEMFISQSTSRKFLDTLEELLTSTKTSPVVRERLLDVVAAAAYASGSKKDGRSDRDGFRGLWKRVKPVEKPEEGMPFDTDDAMFNPPTSARLSQYAIPQVSYQEPSPLPGDTIPPTPASHPHRKRKSPTRNRIIPPEEDRRRLFQECKIGQGNAALLSQALALSKPEDLKKKDVIKEFYLKCRSSQELIFAQIPWASAGAERSRLAQDSDETHMKSEGPDNLPYDTEVEKPVELTAEEKLLAALLAANAELIEALNQYEDLERVAMERKAEDRSRKETRIDRRQVEHYISGAESPSHSADRNTLSRSPSPASHSPPSSYLAHHQHYDHPESSTADLSLPTQMLAPPPAPHGPRSPAQLSMHSRTSSPGTPSLDSPILSSQLNGHDLHEAFNDLHLQTSQSRLSFASYEGDNFPSVQPSAKALGKQKATEPAQTETSFHPDDLYFENVEGDLPLNDPHESDQDEESTDGRWHHPPVHYVYDAAAERTQQRIREGNALVVNGVH